MRDWFFRGMGVLRDTFREEGGGGGSAVEDDEVEIDPGAEFTHDVAVPAARTDKQEPAAKGADDEVAQLREENARLARENAESKRDVEFWNAQARRAQNKPEPVAATEDDEDDTDDLPDVKPEDLINDLAKEGLGALKKHGMLTKGDLDRAIKQIRGETQQTVQQARGDAEFGIRVKDEFPDIAAESEKMRTDPSYKPSNPLFLETAKIYRAAIAEDPSLDGKPSTFLMCARQARAELKASGKDEGKGAATVDKGRQRTERRQRIEQQAAPRSTSRARENSGDGATELSSTQAQVVKNLSRFGVTEEGFLKQAERGSRRG